MKRINIISAVLTLVSFVTSIQIEASKIENKEIETKEIDYSINGAPFKGFLALPKGKDVVPGVLVVHEWWGHNEYARKRAKMLAKLGYAAFALDMYGKDKLATDPKQAEHFMGEAMNSGQIQNRFNEAIKVLKNSGRVNPNKLAAIGYCFGGNVVLNMAINGEPLKAVVSFHGSLPKKADLKEGSVKPQILVLHGAADQFISTQAMDDFKKEMDTAKANYKVVVYPNAKHGFTDPDASKKGQMHHIPIGYDKQADLKSWEEMKELFKKVL